jgi:hypothetical protein
VNVFHFVRTIDEAKDISKGSSGVMTSPLVSGPNMLYRDAAVWHCKGNATIVTVAKLAAADQLIYASEKEMPCPMKT